MTYNIDNSKLKQQIEVQLEKYFKQTSFKLLHVLLHQMFGFFSPF